MDSAYVISVNSGVIDGWRHHYLLSRNRADATDRMGACLLLGYVFLIPNFTDARRNVSGTRRGGGCDSGMAWTGAR